jgi:transcription antitermination factor NusG
VYLNSEEFQHIKRFSGFVNYVRFNGRPATIGFDQINLIKHSLNNDYEVAALANRLVVGAKVEIIAGSLAGYQGTLVELNSKHAVAIEIQGLEQSMLLTVPVERLKIINEAENE